MIINVRIQSMRTVVHSLRNKLTSRFTIPSQNHNMFLITHHNTIHLHRKLNHFNTGTNTHRTTLTHNSHHNSYLKPITHPIHNSTTKLHNHCLYHLQSHNSKNPFNRLYPLTEATNTEEIAIRN
jgi:hypothetical protein